MWLKPSTEVQTLSGGLYVHVHNIYVHNSYVPNIHVHYGDMCNRHVHNDNMHNSEYFGRVPKIAYFNTLLAFFI